jgi:Arc/MetJ-type ribon-helix-helix transcriptional regulator
VKNVTVSLDDETYRNARRRAAENDRSLSSVVREALQSYGAQESDTDRRLHRMQEIWSNLDAKGIGVDASARMTRDELYDPDRVRAERRKSWE